MQPQLKISILEAPADKLLVEAVNAFEIRTPERNVIASQPRAHGDSTTLVESAPFGLGLDAAHFIDTGQVDEPVIADQVQIDAIRGLLVESQAISANHAPAAALFQVDTHMIGRKDSIAIDKQQVGGRRRGDALIAAARQLEAVVIVRREIERKRNAPRQRSQHRQRVVP
jgi:hypothetical protein